MLSTFHTLPQIYLYTSTTKSMLITCCFFITCVYPMLWARPWEMNPAVDSISDLFYELSLWICFLTGRPTFLTGLNKDPKIP